MRRAIEQARRRYEAFENSRSACMETAGKLRAECKAAINFIVKGNVERGRKILEGVPALLRSLERSLKKDPYLYSVPNLNEGLEEYVEGALLLHYVEAGKGFPTPGALGVNHEAYIGGLCDMSGELVRIARRDPGRAAAIHEDVSVMYTHCIKMYVKRNNKVRAKLQDLERNLRKLEEILYEQR